MDTKPITISEFVGADKDSFNRYMLAKSAIIRMGSEKGSVTLSKDEKDALFEFVDGLREFYGISIT